MWHSGAFREISGADVDGRPMGKMVRVEILWK